MGKETDFAEKLFAKAQPANQEKPEVIEIPGVGKAYVYDMPAARRDWLEQIWASQRQYARNGIMENIRGPVIVAGAFDEKGRPLFKFEQVAKLADVPSTLTEELVDAIDRRNKVFPKTIKALEGNSESGQSGPHGTESQANSDAQSLKLKTA